MDLDSYEYSELLKKLESKIDNIKSIINPEGIKKRLGEIETLENSADFWSDAKRAASIQKEKNKLTSMLKNYESAISSVEDAKELFELAQARGTKRR